MEGALGVTHRESIKISSKRKKAFSLAPSSRQELQRLGKQITSESIAEQILKSTGQEESAQLCIKKPTRTKMGSKFGWTCGENGCSHVSYQENAALRHILTHMNLHVLCFGCRQSFGSSVISLKRHVEQAYRKDKTGLCVLGNPSVEKQMPTPGKKNCGNTSPWQEKRFTQSATLIERGSQFEGGARLVRIKWV
ncbi:hypothetical protein K439DRAFT_1627623 [Ramaria rubella]|nr:hypothetical protein K439DRAFT_1627623 [Ramaria rubella]